MLHLAKDILDQKELKVIQKGLREMHWWLRDRSYRSKLRAGVHRLPLAFLLGVGQHQRLIEQASQSGPLLQKRLLLRRGLSQSRLQRLACHADARYINTKRTNTADNVTFVTAVPARFKSATVVAALFTRAVRPAAIPAWHAPPHPFVA